MIDDVAMIALKNIIYRVIKYAVRILNIAFYYGNRRYCPICERSFRKFLDYGAIRRKDARCPYCGSLERHRFLWIFLMDRTNLFNSVTKRLLHIAPEECYELKLKDGLKSGYLSADINNPRAMIKMDITSIGFMDNAFDIVFCCHVLEHIIDDKIALKELFRVLKGNGWAILNVPITAPATFEDPSIVDQSLRLKHYGLEDHVRRYGPDYVDRLKEAGFGVTTIHVHDLVDNQNTMRFGLSPASGEIFYCVTTKSIKYRAWE